jgi:parvulin-like peptidyl-prolyl isomerase
MRAMISHTGGASSGLSKMRGIASFLLLFPIVVIHADEIAPTSPTAVAAKLDGEPILAAEIEAQFRLTYGDRKFSPAERSQLFRMALDLAIDRRLVLASLAKIGQAASKEDVDSELTKLDKEFKAQGSSLAQHCEQTGFTPSDIRRSVGWKLSWQRYCEKQLTPQNLEKYFDRNRREFDGTQLHVAQILFKLAADADNMAIASAKQRAADVRQEIASGKLNFAAAAKQHSEAPSRENGGDIGWIERHRPMPEGFSQAAFALKKGEVSEPLVNSFGVSLVTVLDEKPGTRTWRDAESELRPAVTLYLFRWLADKERGAAKIEYVATP